MQAFNLTRTAVAAGLILASGVVASANASAATVASFSIDWLDASYTSANQSFSWLSNQSTAYSDILTAQKGGTASGVQSQITGWPTTSFSAVSGGAAVTDSVATGSAVITSVIATPVSTSGDILRQQDFFLAAGDTATITVPYTFTFAAGYAGSTGSFSISGIDYTSFSTPASSVNFTSDATGGTYSGTLTFSYSTAADTTVALGLEANVAAVPEPGSYALMIGGLLALAAVARRRAA